MANIVDEIEKCCASQSATLTSIKASFENISDSTASSVIKMGNLDSKVTTAKESFEQIKDNLS
jgi:uncharacterized protein with von Willebrand factor type A (vWA) domain